MGAAKRRGSFEQRKAEAIVKAEAKKAEIESRWKKDEARVGQIAPESSQVARIGGKRAMTTNRHITAAIIAASFAAKGES